MTNAEPTSKTPVVSTRLDAVERAALHAEASENQVTPARMLRRIVRGYFAAKLAGQGANGRD